VVKIRFFIMCLPLMMVVSDSAAQDVTAVSERQAIRCVALWKESREGVLFADS